MSRPRDWVLLSVLAVFAAASVALAFGFRTDQFLSALLMEAAGMAIGVLSTVILVERLLEKRRQHQWSRMRQQWVRNAQRALEYVAFLFDPDTSWLERDPGRATLEHFADLVHRMDAVDPELVAPSAKELYTKAEPKLQRLLDVTLPQIAEQDPDRELLERWAALERAARHWSLRSSKPERDPQGEWSAARITLDAAYDVYAYLCDPSKPAPSEPGSQSDEINDGHWALDIEQWAPDIDGHRGQRRPWAIDARGEPRIGLPGQFHADLEAEPPLCASGEVTSEGQVVQFMGDIDWVNEIERLLRAEPPNKQK